MNHRDYAPQDEPFDGDDIIEGEWVEESDEDFDGPDAESGRPPRSHRPRDHRDHGGHRRHERHERYRGDRGPRRGEQADGPMAYLLGPDGPFGQHGIFGPGGPLSSGGPFGPKGGPFGRGRSGWEEIFGGAEGFPGQRAPRDRGPRGGGPRGGRGGGRRRRGDVRTAALFLIAEEPRNGYQIIEELAARTGGSWRPSSGAIYPALAQLEDEGLIEAFDNAGRKAYRLTDAGRTQVDAHEGPKPWEDAADEAQRQRRHMGGQAGGGLWSTLGQVGMAAHAVSQSGDETAIRQATALLEQAKKDLYRLLADGASVQDAPTDEPDRDQG